MIRTVIALVFLAFQIVMIVRARFDPLRYYCWAPHDRQTQYRIDVTIDGRRLTDDEIAARYRDPWNGVNPRCEHHVFLFLERFERTHGSDDDAEVVVTYHVNGGPENQWRWPRP